MLQQTETFADMTNALQDSIGLIHSNGGLTVNGWYKRGVTNGQSLITRRNMNNHNHDKNNNKKNKKTKTIIL